MYCTGTGVCVLLCVLRLMTSGKGLYGVFVRCQSESHVVSDKRNVPTRLVCGSISGVYFVVYAFCLLTTVLLKRLSRLVVSAKMQCGALIADLLAS